MIIRSLSTADIFPEMLRDFDRSQPVTLAVRQGDCGRYIKKCKYIDNWSADERKQMIRTDFSVCLAGGAVWGAYEGERLIGFSALYPQPFGSDGQYRILPLLHVSAEFRRQGIGRALFLRSTESARLLGAKKLYISTNSAYESQLFYRALGCRDALEIDAQSAAHEPYDIQLEYDLTHAQPVRFLHQAPCSIIGQAGEGEAGLGAVWIQPLWQAANARFAEISALACLRGDGLPDALWGAMSDTAMHYQPWTARGRYLAGCAVNPDAVCPSGWEKWELPEWDVVCADTNEAQYQTVFRAVLDMLPQMGLLLAGAVQEKYDPRYGNGQLTLVFPYRANIR